MVGTIVGGTCVLVGTTVHVGRNVLVGATVLVAVGSNVAVGSSVAVGLGMFVEVSGIVDWGIGVFSAEGVQPKTANTIATRTIKRDIESSYENEKA